MLIMDNYSQDEIMTIFCGYLKIESRIICVDNSRDEIKDQNELEANLETCEGKNNFQKCTTSTYYIFRLDHRDLTSNHS